MARAVLLVIGAVAFGISMEIHAGERPLRTASIYYCATGVEFPEFEPCKEQKDQKDI